MKIFVKHNESRQRTVGLDERERTFDTTRCSVGSEEVIVAEDTIEQTFDRQRIRSIDQLSGQM